MCGFGRSLRLTNERQADMATIHRLTDYAPASRASVVAAKAAMVAYRREHFTGPNQEVDEDGKFIVHCTHCFGYKAVADTIGLAVVDITKHIAREHRPLSA
jgi:spermidine synthase